MDLHQAHHIVSEVFSLYDEFGETDYIGESVTQIQHMAQAGHLALDEGYEDDVVLAAFFHDIGHLCEHILPVQLMDGVGVMDHEKIGADFLRQRGFSEKVCKLVECHVQAKRYLTYKYFDYYQKLSPASKITLDHQGGIMDAEEAEEFEMDELHTLYIKMREWDDKAKITKLPKPSLEFYRLLTMRHLIKQQEISQ